MIIGFIDSTQHINALIYMFFCNQYNYVFLAKVEEEMRKSPLSMFDPLTKVTNLQDNNLLHNG